VRTVGEFVKVTLVGGLLVIVPVCLVVMLLLKVFSTVVELVHPLAARLPTGVRFANFVSLLLIVAACFIVGLLVRTPTGRRAGAFMDRRVLGRVPGYSLLQTVTQRMAGRREDHAMAPAFATFEGALVPAFIIEEHRDGHYTVFVPAAPTPGVGAVYILPRERVHIVDVPFHRMVACVSNWGTNLRDLVPSIRRS
jgi:uncharacterized membrane protein